MTCKIGDLAIIRGMKSVPESNGKIVKIVGVAMHGDIFRSTDGIERRVDTDGLKVWRVCGREPLPWTGSLGKRYFIECPMRDDRLIPIGGVPVTDDIEDEVTA